MTTIYVKKYRYATFGVAGWISITVEYDGQIYRGVGPFYNTQPEDHITSENEDVFRINPIVRQTLSRWNGLCIIENDVISVPLFYEVSKYDKNPQYHSTKGSSFGIIIKLHLNARIRTDIPWQTDINPNTH